jgi:hypothetical protein
MHNVSAFYIVPLATDVWQEVSELQALKSDVQKSIYFAPTEHLSHRAINCLPTVNVLKVHLDLQITL